MTSDLVVIQASDLQQLNFLHQGSTRLKVVCFDLSPSTIVLGANSGTVYVLDHETLTLKHQIPTEAGSVVELSISHDECLVACALSSGTVEVFEVVRAGGSRHLIRSREHEGDTVSSLAWSHSSSELYIGDTSGRISVLYIPKSKTAAFFRSSCAHLMTLESGVMQLDYSNGYLLVSTLTRSYICNTNLETFMQIGTKLRQGEYGGCFCQVNPSSSSSAQATGFTKNTQQDMYENLDHQNVEHSLSSSGKFALSDCYEAVEEEKANQSNPSKEQSDVAASRIFCARPGTRIWEADHSGKVLVTHQLKRALMVPPADVLYTDGTYGEQELLEEIDKTPYSKTLGLHSQYADHVNSGLVKTQTLEKTATGGLAHYAKSMSVASHPPVSVAFTKLLSFYTNYLLAISTYGLYVIDPTNSKVLLWISVSDSVTDVKVSGNTLIYKTGSGGIHNLMITTVDIAILLLHTRSLPVECAHLCLQNQEIFIDSELLSRLGTKILTDLSLQIKSKVIREKLQDLMAYAGLDEEKENKISNILIKSGVAYVRNDRFDKEEIKEGISSTLGFGHRVFLPLSVTRWYSEPYLRQGQAEKTVVHRCTVSVANSPLHHAQGNNNQSSSVCVQDTHSQLTLTRFASDDTLQSKSSHEFLDGLNTASHISRKSNTMELDNDRRVNSPSLSSGRCSQQSDYKSHKSFESSLEMYEDPLFSSDNSSPDLELASRIFLDSNQPSVNAYDSHKFYNLAYAPIHPGSEAATLFQDLMENVATNMVDTITSGTKNLTERLKTVTPLISSGDGSSRKLVDGQVSMLDMVGSSCNTDQEDQLQSSTSADTDEAEGINTSIVIKTKAKKKRIQNGCGATQPTKSLTTASAPIEEISHPNMELPGVVRNLHDLVTSTFHEILKTDNEAEAYTLLTQWLEVYFSTVQQIQPSKHMSRQASEDTAGDGPVSLSSVESPHSQGSGRTSCDSLHWDSSDIGFEPSAMSADILEQITELFLQCLQAGVCINGIYNAKIAPGLHKQDSIQHPLTPEAVKKLDSLYASLLSNDCGLLRYSNLLNALDTVGHHYYIMTWMTLLERVTSNSDKLNNQLLTDIIPDLDFTRSQRVSILYKLASSGNMTNFITVAAQIENPFVIMDVIFMLNHVAVFRPHLHKHLLHYLIELSHHKNLVKLYLNYWTSCPELQYDILSALLNTAESSSFSCSCGMPLPLHRPMALEKLADTIVDHDILDPKQMSELCRRMSFWKGFCIITLAYKLQSTSQCIPFILQNCSLYLLDDIMEILDTHDYGILFNVLASLTSEDPSVMKCYRCRSAIHFPEKEEESNGKKQKTFEYTFQVNAEPYYTELNSKDFNSEAEISLDASKDINGQVEEQVDHCGASTDASVYNMGELWEAVVVQVLRRAGAVETLRLLTQVQHKIPSGILTERVYSWCIFSSLAERRGPAACWSLFDTLTHTRKKFYSHKVATSLHRHDAIDNRTNEESEGLKLSQCSSKNGEIENEVQVDENDEHTPPRSSALGATPGPLGHHWGVQTQVLQGVCFCCHLKLPTQALVSEGGITVFPCSHAFHTICLAHRGHCCVICAHSA
ncbi:hypothetical protein OTU49_015580, partial [Cherax quadricarinatus]